MRLSSHLTLRDFNILLGFKKSLQTKVNKKKYNRKVKHKNKVLKGD